MQTKYNQTAAGNYAVTKETANFLDCLRGSNNYFITIADAMHERYDSIMSSDEVDKKLAPYLDALNDIAELLYEEVRTCLVDALNDAGNTEADVIKL